MVKLLFKPDQKSENVIESITSKRIERSLNPFELVENVEIDLSCKKELISSSQLVGLENCRYVLNDWYQANNQKILIIVGPTGCGKTTLVESYCQENGIGLYTVRSTETIKSRRDLLRDLFCFAEYNPKNFFVKREIGSRKLILIDEYQNGPNDILGITDIQNLNMLRDQKSRTENKRELKIFLNDLDCPFTMPPIILISADSRGSKLSDLKKTHEVYYINEIPNNIIFTWAQKLYPKTDKKLLKSIVDKCKSDKRMILNNLEFSSLNKNETNFVDTFFKDEEKSMFEFLSVVFENEHINLNEIFRIYETDGFMLSNLVHENYLEYNQDIHAIADSAENISLGETLFSNTYESTRTFIPEIHCLHSICIPGYHSRTDRINKNPRTSCINNRYNIYLNNVKIMQRINLHENTLTVFDILYIKKFLNQNLVKSKQLTVNQEDYLKSIIGTLKSTEKLELIYKHFSDFSSRELKTKNFTIKFKDKLKYLSNNGI
jgi:ABC-type dipeptide/oligopeptide/nickel transport system ATPase component